MSAARRYASAHVEPEDARPNASAAAGALTETEKRFLAAIAAIAVRAMLGNPTHESNKQTGETE